MRSQEIARRYAAALYQVAVEDVAVGEIEDELAVIAEGTAESLQIRRFLAHPLVPRESKAAFLSRAFPETTDRMRHFIEVLIRNRRETYLDLIYEEFVELRTVAEGMIRVTVTTAETLSGDDRVRLVERLEKALDRPVKLEENMDESVLGGMRVEAAGHVLDGTLRTRLSELRKHLENRGTR